MKNSFTSESARQVRRRVREELARADARLSDVVRANPTLDYARVIRVLNGYSAPLEGEVDRIIEVIQAAGRNSPANEIAAD